LLFNLRVIKLQIVALGRPHVRHEVQLYGLCMPHSRAFKLFVPPPPGYGDMPSVSHATGAAVRIETDPGSGRRLFRSRLPDTSQLIFAFPKAAGVERIQNFYHMGDYLIVSEPMHGALWPLFGARFESAPIRMLHENGASSETQYFAVRINNVIDCIDPGRSTWRPKYSSKLPEEAFSAAIITAVLEPRLCHEFANRGRSEYVSYPSFMEAYIKGVTLHKDRIPIGTLLFQPTYWPGHWIIDAGFADRLERVCGGGHHGYYFWALDLGDVEASYSEKMFKLR
jgi:hypothetical protein